MKKLFTVIGILMTICITVLTIVWTVYGQFSLQDIIGSEYESQWVSTIITFITSAGGVGAIMAFLLKGLKRESGNYQKAQEGIKEVKEETASMMSEVVKALSESKAARDEAAEYKAELSEIKQLISQDLAINRIALLNDPHLVANGYAAEIKNVLKEPEDVQG